MKQGKCRVLDDDIPIPGTACVHGQFNTNANLNFITASSAQYSAGNNLFFGESITGSIAEIRGWDAYVSMSKFKQHILNYKSVVGGKVTSARDSLVYHYPLSDKESSTAIKDISSPSKVSNFDKTVSSQPSLNVKSSTSDVKNFSFQVRGTDAVKSDKQYKIGSNLKSVGGLNSKAATLKQPVKPGTNESKVKVINKIGKTYSYVDAIDSIVINAMADFEIDDYLDDYDNNGIYDDLLTLRKQLIEERLVSVDVVKNHYISHHPDEIMRGNHVFDWVLVPDEGDRFEGPMTARYQFVPVQSDKCFFSTMSEGMTDALSDHFGVFADMCYAESCSSGVVVEGHRGATGYVSNHGGFLMDLCTNPHKSALHPH